MEDFFDVKLSKVDGQTVCMFGIFDGETYQKTDSEFLDSERHSSRDDGSTASTAVLVGRHLYVANVGDSRAVISKAGKAIALSDDHKPNRSDERRRIENAGGIVMWAGTWRVGGVLAMSRAFGNRLLKQFVVAEPEIQEDEVDEELEFMVLASDGLWDVVPNEDAVTLAGSEDEPEAAARKLTEAAYTRGSADNITCIVVRFHHDKMDDKLGGKENELSNNPGGPPPSPDRIALIKEGMPYAWVMDVSPIKFTNQFLPKIMFPKTIVALLNVGTALLFMASLRLMGGTAS
ncbi:putative protein phosphatase 2C 52 [Acorus calamus]|uniref:protein-serine/threonine phosphatase n=1 Tax=Acorus calamus TaxID=4465 RepID=A0AAV9FHT7_ACOCL|nr:putative protein phosphatase 2C 52 [Acorus calamus]